MSQKILVKYNPETKIVCGYFLKDQEYYGNSINLEDRTIDGFPFIEIEIEDQIEGNMVVIDGIYQEYEKTEEEILIERKNILISTRIFYMESTDWYASRLIKRNVAIPLEVIERNILAASEINQINAATNLIDLLEFSEEF
jgi:hypothetical protein